MTFFKLGNKNFKQNSSGIQEHAGSYYDII